jgi:hypothetical protein
MSENIEVRLDASDLDPLYKFRTAVASRSAHY